MSRLLFAAARGARIQRQQEAVYSNRTWWEDVQIQWGMDDELRIHPDDKHLQYGPISTALRERANLNGEVTGGLGMMLALPFVEYHRRGAAKTQGELHRSLFLLILAEALADEGL
jgi:hypothetical protein